MEKFFTKLSLFKAVALEEIRFWINKPSKLITAMANYWQHEQSINKKLTFKEAQNFLSKHRMVKQFYTSKIETGYTYFWYDNEGNMVAQTPFRSNNKTDDDFYILVLNAIFTEEKAKTLLKCYKTMKITVIAIE